MTSPIGKKIILASASPRRRELLQQIGVTFTVITADIDETPHPNENPVRYTLRLAEEKARTILAGNLNSIVIGADTTVLVDGQILGKTTDTADAERMLTLLQGRTHQVITGIAVLSETQTELAAETTDVTFAAMSDTAIRAYIATGEPMDKAGAYGLQGRAARYIPRIEGDYSNVVGLPLARLATLLDKVR